MEVAHITDIFFFNTIKTIFIFFSIDKINFIYRTVGAGNDAMNF